jgi:hypothetical protein
MAKKKGKTLADVNYPDAQPARSSVKQIDAEADDRGGVNSSKNIYQTAKKAAADMGGRKSRGTAYGASEAHAIAQRDGDGTEPTGSFKP